MLLATKLKTVFDKETGDENEKIREFPKIPQFEAGISGIFGMSGVSTTLAEHKIMFP
jgi:hypothetical protein